MNTFSIFKVKDHNGDEKKPTHSISTKIGEKYEYIGKCWTRESNGQKYLSCSLDKEYKGKPGYSISKDTVDSIAEVDFLEDIPF